MGIRLSKIFLRFLGFLVCLALFILSLMMMKIGARPLEPVIRGVFSVDSPTSALGFGWLVASLVLSGSPVAATALSLLDAGVLNPAEAFGMIAGSRLGASFLVLVLGFIYVFRGQKRQLSLGVGLVSLLVTQTIYPLVLLLGFFLMSFDLHFVPFFSQQELVSPLEGLITPLLSVLENHLPSEILLILGFLVVMFSLWAFDRIIPEIKLKETDLGKVARVLYRPIIVFLLGALVTILTMSVSVSLGLLVPLSVRGYIRQENLIPYILGANTTTFIDTLIAAVLLNNPDAIMVVAIQMFSVFIVSVFILVSSLRFYERIINFFSSLISRKNPVLLMYILLIIGIPLGLIWFG